MNGLARLRAVTFDFWGTLYSDTSARDKRLRLFEEVLARHSQPRDWSALEAAYSHVHGLWERLWREERRSITCAHWMREMLGFLQVSLPDDVLAELRRPVEGVYLDSDAPFLIPGVAAVISRLSRRYRLGLISDVGLTPGWVLREILRRDGLLPHFGALTFSDETGLTKPCAEQFLHTLDALGARPGEAAHIGDLSETDLAGARGVGMKAILFLGASHRDDGLPLADVAFEEYGELEAALGRLG
jgi:putative hydrolase of the HAD superfamily